MSAHDIKFARKVNSIAKSENYRREARRCRHRVFRLTVDRCGGYDAPHNGIMPVPCSVSVARIRGDGNRMEHVPPEIRFVLLYAFIITFIFEKPYICISFKLKN